MSHVNKGLDKFLDIYITIVLNKYLDHSGIFSIQQYFNEPTEFDFTEEILNDIEKEMKNLNGSKNGCI